MSTAASTAASTGSHPRVGWSELNPFADLRVQYGIKVGAAAVLALWIAQALRLEHPNWSVLAVLVLANGHYVGAIATKALMRAVGTVAGGLIGVWLIGDYANSPVVFIFWTFVVVAIATYKSSQLASATWPYAYYPDGAGTRFRRHLRHHRPGQRVAHRPLTHPGNAGGRRHGHGRLRAPLAALCA